MNDYGGDIAQLPVDFRLTSDCPFDCGLCFRNPDIPDLRLDDVRAIMGRLRDLGISRIGFTGGEPTVRSDYVDVIVAAKSMGYLTYLSTTGRKFMQDSRRLEGILDWVGLPLDAVSPTIAASIRCDQFAQQHLLIQDILYNYECASSRIRLKLTTVVAKPNLFHLSDILEFVAPLADRIAVWRFYQFCPIGLAKRRSEALTVDTGTFMAMMFDLHEHYPGIPMSWATFEERNKANLIIEPNGDMIIPDYDTYTYLCNPLRDSAAAVIASIIADRSVVQRCMENRKWLA